MPMVSHTTMDTVTEEWYFLRGPYLDVISRTITDCCSVQLSEAQESEELVGKLEN